VTDRKPLKKSVRFEVFKRDGFICQYCGAHPPAVILHVDHIHPVAEGGTDDIDNLITACEPCNLGKSARLLQDIPKTLKDRAAEIEELERQIEGYNAVLTARAQRLEDETWRIAGVLENDPSIDSYRRSDLASIKRFLELLPFIEVLDAAEIAASKPYTQRSAFKYFCGICWRKIREEQEQ
jgi:hypothetical protein